MPKRTRCPHCDRLFSRDQIDTHIRKCRLREERSRGAKREPRRRAIIVDGNNIAYHLAYNEAPRIANLVNAIKSLTEARLHPTIVISAALKHKIDKPENLRHLINEGDIIEVQRGTNDDLAIIKMAQERNADIISNDRFLDWIDRFPWLPDRLRRYRMTPSGLILV
ncbi:MAG: hypothetical protein RTV31_16720 [Candidatus Thorarchaeota archaeon]